MLELCCEDGGTADDGVYGELRGADELCAEGNEPDEPNEPWELEALAPDGYESNPDELPELCCEGLERGSMAFESGTRTAFILSSDFLRARFVASCIT